MVLDSISHCDVDVRKELYAGVVLTGGSSLISSMRDRLERELVAAGPQAAKIKVSMPINTLERRFSVWLGEGWEGAEVATALRNTDAGAEHVVLSL